MDLIPKVRGSLVFWYSRAFYVVSLDVQVSSSSENLVLRQVIDSNYVVYGFRHPLEAFINIIYGFKIF